MYGWVCARCVDELDRYYLLLHGLRGGDIADLVAQDVAAGRLPPAHRHG